MTPVFRHGALSALLCSTLAWPANSATILIGDADLDPPFAGAGARLTAGETSSGGYIEVNGGSVVTLDPGEPTGSATLFGIGRRGPGVAKITGEGSAVVMNGAATDTIVNVGGASGGRVGSGELTIDDGGRLVLDDVGDASGFDPTNIGGDSIRVGTNVGSFGRLTLDGGAIETTSQSGGAFVWVGMHGGEGELLVSNGSTLTLDGGASTTGTNLTLGRGDRFDEFGQPLGATGFMSVTESTVTITADNFAGFFVGREVNTEGTLILGQGAEVTVDGAPSVFIVARDAGSVGNVEIIDGATITVAGDRSFTLVGGSDSVSPNAGEGSLLIAGEGSRLETRFLLTGAVGSRGGLTGSGVVTVRDGGILAAEEIYVGTNATLQGDGVIEGTVILDGGTASPGFSPGLLTIDGDFEILGGLLSFEIGGLGLDEYDRIDVLGDVIVSEPFTFSLDFINGFRPAVGDVFELFRISGDPGDFLTLAIAGLEVKGLPNGFDFALREDGGSLFAAATSVAPIPIPGALPLLATALGAVAMLRGCRRPHQAA